MIEYSELLAAAYNTERTASRRLAVRSGLSEEHELRAVLTQKAGAAGLAQLLLERAADRAAAAGRDSARQARHEALRMARRERHTPPASAWRAWFDGSARPNPGHCSIGAVLAGPEGERIEISSDIGYGNSSQAEYRALIAVLEAAVRAGAHDLAIHGDSRVVIDDVTGPDADAAPSLAMFRAQAITLLGQIGKASLHWVPRHKNGAADALSQQRCQDVKNITDVT